VHGVLGMLETLVMEFESRPSALAYANPLLSLEILIHEHHTIFVYFFVSLFFLCNFFFPFSHLFPVSIFLLLSVCIIPMCQYGTLDGKLLTSHCSIESKVARNILL
jgi:hypothetical protein